MRAPKLPTPVRARATQRGPNVFDETREERQTDVDHSSRIARAVLYSKIPTTSGIMDISDGLQGPSPNLAEEPHNPSIGYQTTYRSGQVAVKIFRTSSEGRKRFTKLLRAELRVWDPVRHRNLLPPCGVCLFGGFPALVSPWCKNGNIISYLAQVDEPSRMRTAMHLLEQILCGLQHLHTTNPAIIHGNLKGANILVSDGGSALLSDFGLATLQAKAATWNISCSSAKCAYRWMAYELAADDDAQPTAASDIWAFGCVMLEVLSGRMPFHDIESDEQVLAAVSCGQCPSRPPGIINRQWQLMLECWRLEPSSRPSAASLLQRVRDLRSDALFLS